MDQAEQIRLIRGMGKAAGVFMALAWFGSAGEKALSQMLGINQATARGYLVSLEVIGLCKRSARYNGFELTELGLELTHFERGKSALERGKTALNPLTTTTIESDLLIDSVVVVDPASAGKPRSEDTPEIQAKWEALTAAGIFRNSTTEQLVAMPHVTPEFIRAHAAAYKPKNGNGKGVLILRLLNNEPLPEAEHKQSYSDWEVIAGDVDPRDDCQDDPEPEVMSEAQEVWGMALQALELQIPKAHFESYVRPVTALAMDCGTLTLQAPSSEARAWLDSRIKRTLENILPGITGDDVTVEFTHLSTMDKQPV